MSTHPQGEDLVTVLDRLALDLESTGLVPWLGVFDLAEREWIAGGADQLLVDLDDLTAFGDEDYVLALPGRQQVVTPNDRRSGPDPVEIVDQVCDWVMDELGKGWPEWVDEDGTFLAILMPAPDDGSVAWKARDLRVPLGTLATVRVAVRGRGGGLRL